MEHAPRRTCVGCRTSRAKPDLLRLAATPDGVAVDPDQQLPGRGAYICPDPRCLDRIERAKGHPLRRALRRDDASETTTALRALRSHLDHRPRHDGAPNDPGRPATVDHTRSTTA